MGQTKQAVLSRAYSGLERFGIHVLPSHYYSPVANRHWMAEHPDFWQERYDMGWDLDEQVDWLRVTCGSHLGEVAGFNFIGAGEQRGIRFRYGQIEGQTLHCVVRRLAPRRIVEVGSGSSTYISSTASDRNLGEGRGGSEITAIDPYAPTQLEELGNVTVRRVPVQEIPPSTFSTLEAGDVLFLDSTHALHAGSELQRLYLKVIPSLAPGVLVHVHDIFLPWMYTPAILNGAWDWQETTLVAALLTGNDKLKVRCCQSALHDARSRELRDIFPDYIPRPLDHGLERAAEGHFPSSLWIEVT